MSTKEKVAAVLDENGIVINRIVVRDLADFPGTVDGTNGNIGDHWDGAKFVRPQQPE